MYWALPCSGPRRMVLLRVPCVHDGRQQSTKVRTFDNTYNKRMFALEQACLARVFCKRCIALPTSAQTYKKCALPYLQYTRSHDHSCITWAQHNPQWPTNQKVACASRAPNDGCATWSVILTSMCTHSEIRKAAQKCWCSVRRSAIFASVNWDVTCTSHAISAEISS